MRGFVESVLGARSSVGSEHFGQKIVLHGQLADLRVQFLDLLFVVPGLARIAAK